MGAFFDTAEREVLITETKDDTLKKTGTDIWQNQAVGNYKINREADY